MLARPPAKKPHGTKAGSQESEARCAEGAWHGGAPRGGPRLDKTQSKMFPSAQTNSARRQGVAVVQCHDMDGAVRHPFMGK
jgi:hypothetical protein